MSEHKSIKTEQRCKLRLRLTQARVDHGNGWLGVISKIVNTIKDALPDIEIAVGEKKTTEVTWSVDASPALTERAADELATDVRKDGEAVLAEGARETEQRLIEAKQSGEVVAPADLEEIEAADAALRAEVEQLRADGYEVELNPVDDRDDNTDAP